MAPHPESDKRIMLELANTHPELPPPYAVFKTNAVSTSLSQGGLFPLLSRVNSSCRPNLTRPLWDAKDGVIRLWAGRDIAEGEELVSRASPAFDPPPQTSLTPFLSALHAGLDVPRLVLSVDLRTQGRDPGRPWWVFSSHAWREHSDS
jgi:hypothetical protein